MILRRPFMFLRDCLSIRQLLGCLLVLVVSVFIGCKSRFIPVTTIETSFFKAQVIYSLAEENSEALQIGVGLATAELKRLEEMFNPINPEGGLYRLNEARNVTSPEMYQILERAQWISEELTAGALNLFMGYLEQAYGFEKVFPEPPNARTIRELLLPVRRANIQFIPERFQVRIPSDAFAVSLTGIQEGYAADQALAHMGMAGIQNAMIQVGSHIAYGGSPSGLGWPIEIEHPTSGEVVVSLYAEYCGVATVSVLDQVYSYRGDTYYNHLDPATGHPARRLSAAVVIAPSCELAAGLARGIFVMEPEQALQLLNELPEVEGLLLDPEGRVARSDSLFLWTGS